MLNFQNFLRLLKACVSSWNRSSSYKSVFHRSLLMPNVNISDCWLILAFSMSCRHVINTTVQQPFRRWVPFCIIIFETLAISVKVQSLKVPSTCGMSPVPPHLHLSVTLKSESKWSKLPFHVCRMSSAFLGISGNLRGLLHSQSLLVWNSRWVHVVCGVLPPEAVVSSSSYFKHRPPHASEHPQMFWQLMCSRLLLKAWKWLIWTTAQDKTENKLKWNSQRCTFP